MLIPQQERRQGLVEASWLQVDAAPQIRPGPKNRLRSHQARVFFYRFGALLLSHEIAAKIVLPLKNLKANIFNRCLFAVLRVDCHHVIIILIHMKLIWHEVLYTCLV